VHLENKEGEGVTLTFEVNGQLQHTTADLVGADSQFSTTLGSWEDNTLYGFRLYCDFRYLYFGIAHTS
jgi:hypothetical protein